MNIINNNKTKGAKMELGLESGLHQFCIFYLGSRIWGTQASPTLRESAGTINLAPGCDRWHEGWESDGKQSTSVL